MNKHYLKNLVAVVGFAALLVGCGEQPAEEKTEAPKAAAPAAPAAEEPKAEPVHPGQEVELTAYMAAAVADPGRPEADTVRDAGRRPGAVLDYYGVAPGMTVLELHGGGYYTRILSKAVGEDGTVIAPMRPGTPEDKRPGIIEGFAAYPNVKLPFANPDEVDLPDNSVDVAFLMLVIHHYHFSAEEGDVMPSYAKKRYENVLRMLKPGGLFGVIEHKAPDDSSREASAKLHRIPGPTAIADLTSVGFEYVGESDLLDGHEEDDITLYWRGNTPRGHTRRIVHTYRKPLAE